MEGTFEIEISKQRQEPICSDNVQLPSNIMTLGEIENDDVKVYIKQDVYQALEKFALADIRHERGTILLGDYYEVMGSVHVVISNYIEARYTDASASTLTFTHETWEYVHQEHDAKYSEKKIIGWQHTHPGYGIFLSNYDLFIQENFFNLTFQVAYVIDPIQNIRGFFQWKREKIEKLKGFYIYDDIGKPIQTEKMIKKQAGALAKKTNAGGFFIAALALALFVTAGSVFSCISYIRIKNLLEEQYQTILTQSHRQKFLEQAYQEQNAYLQSVQNSIMIRNSDGQTAGQTVSIEELLELYTAQQSDIARQQVEIEELRRMVEAREEQMSEPEKEKISYIVKVGDTLNGICDELGIDYWKNRSAILELNHIQNENIILVNQELRFPYDMAE